MKFWTTYWVKLVHRGTWVQGSSYDVALLHHQDVMLKAIPCLLVPPTWYHAPISVLQINFCPTYRVYYVHRGTFPGFFIKGPRLSPVSGWASGSNLSLLSQLSLWLKQFSQKGSQLRPSLSMTTVVFCVMWPFFVVKTFYWWHVCSLCGTWLSLVIWYFAMGNLINL